MFKFHSWSSKKSLNKKRKFYNRIHSQSKCLVWVKMCCHIWLDQNFDPSLLTNKLWLVFMGMKQKNIFFLEKRKQSKKYFEKLSVFESAILIFFSFISVKTSQNLLVSKDGSKFWSSQIWKHFLVQTKYFEGKCIV